MATPNELLSDLTVHAKYARYMPEAQRRETFTEITHRNHLMNVNQVEKMVANDLGKELMLHKLSKAYQQVHDKKVLPSMRSMQFGGLPIEIANNRVYNCGFMPIDAPEAFSEAMFLLLGGTGLGFSVQSAWIAKLPAVCGPKERTRRYVIDDSIEGWADAVKVLVNAHFYGKSKPVFDFRQIREKGAPLITSGGKAPGPEPLKICLAHLEAIFNRARGRQLSTLEVFDLVCYIADAVLAGGIRRAALICLFDNWDVDMLTCKTGNWGELNPQRGRANISAVLVRGIDGEDTFREVMDRCRNSGYGEPAVYWTNDPTMGTNPCCEIALKPFQFCNLTEINGAAIETEDDLLDAAWAASVIGTMQASFTDFHYLREIWRDTTEEEALIGVGITGSCAPVLRNQSLLEDAASIVVQENAVVAQILGINPAARCTTVKPSGTTSCVLGSSSGIHTWHAPYYVRRMRIGKAEAVYQYLLDTVPELVEDCYEKPHLDAVLSLPQKAGEGPTRMDESAIDLLERVKFFHSYWIAKGHNSGCNTHNVSCTVSIKPDEWDDVINWMWDNRDCYNGIACLDYDGGNYVQAPFEDITEDEYNEMAALLADRNFDITNVLEEMDETDLSGEAACAAGACLS